MYLINGCGEIVHTFTTFHVSIIHTDSLGMSLNVLKLMLNSFWMSVSPRAVSLTKACETGTSFVNRKLSNSSIKISTQGEAALVWFESAAQASVVSDKVNGLT